MESKHLGGIESEMGTFLPSTDQWKFKPKCLAKGWNLETYDKSSTGLKKEGLTERD